MCMCICVCVCMYMYMYTVYLYNYIYMVMKCLKNLNLFHPSLPHEDSSWIKQAVVVSF